MDGMRVGVAAALIAVMIFGSQAAGQDAGEAQVDYGELIRQLQDHIARQDERIAELEQRQQAVEQHELRREQLQAMMTELMEESAKHPGVPAKWLENLNFVGDFRLRYEGNCFNTDALTRNRVRIRLRFGFVKTWPDEQLEVGFRLASGEASSAFGGEMDPRSTNQTFTNNFSGKRIWIDWAYAKWTPKAVNGLTLIGGKMPNPLMNTDIVWDADVTPEGFWGMYTLPHWKNFQPYAGAGFFELFHNAAEADAALLAYQAGWRWQISEHVKLTSAVTYYDFRNYEDNFSVAAGNTVANGQLSAGEFNTFNMTHVLAFKALGLPMNGFADYVVNCASEDGEREAFAIGGGIGENKKKRDMAFKYKYAYIEANATPGGFNDATFGGTNRKGHVWFVGYNITDYLIASTSLYYTQPVSGQASGDTTTTILGELTWKF